MKALSIFPTNEFGHSTRPQTSSKVISSSIKKKLFSDWKKDKKNIKILNSTNSGYYFHFGEPEWVITELEAYHKSLKLCITK